MTFRPLLQIFELLTLYNTHDIYRFSVYRMLFRYTHPDLSQEVRLIIGLVMATVVLFADAYFLVKTLDE